MSKCVEDMGLKHMTCSLPSEILQDIASVDEIKSDDTDLTVHEKVPFTLNKVLEQIFKEMEEQHHDSHFKDSDSDDNNDLVNTDHSWPLPAPSHKEALQCVCLY
jgi:hypothetical protein